jgi:hypothetical protein
LRKELEQLKNELIISIDNLQKRANARLVELQKEDGVFQNLMAQLSTKQEILNNINNILNTEKVIDPTEISKDEVSDD